MGKLITIGLAEIQVGVASDAGVMPHSLTKIGSTYRDTCKITQAEAEVTEHFEEGLAVPRVRNKTKNVPVLAFSIMDPDVQTLIDYIGGKDVSESGGAVWGFDGSEIVPNRAIRVKSKQGLWVDIPNADIEAVIDADMSDKGLFMVNFTVTPMSVSNGRAIMAYDGTTGLVVDENVLSFDASGIASPDEIIVTSTGPIEYAAAPTAEEWVVVTYANKTVSVAVSENENTEERRTIVTIKADGKYAYVTVIQAGASA